MRFQSVRRAVDPEALLATAELDAAQRAALAPALAERTVGLTYGRYLARHQSGYGPRLLVTRPRSFYPPPADPLSPNNFQK